MSGDELEVATTNPSRSEDRVRLEIDVSERHFIYPFAFIYELGLRCFDLRIDRPLQKRGMIRGSLSQEAREAVSTINHGLLEEIAEVAPPEEGNEFSSGGEVAYWPSDPSDYAEAFDVALEVVDDQEDESDRGFAPDDRDIKDVWAVEECPTCGWSPAAVILTPDGPECYNCAVEVHQ